MLKNYFKIAYRTLVRQKGHAFINVAGLALGLACAFLILLWVQDELRYDRFHAQQDSLFVAKRHAYFAGGQVLTSSSLPVPASRALEAQFPEVQDAEMVSWPQRLVLAAGGEAYREAGYWADDAFFELFSFPLLEGDPATALDQPNGIVLSEALAAKLFGPDWRAQGVLGRSVRVDSRADFQVTGVAAPVPDHSTLQFDFVLPAADFYAQNEWLTEDWGSSSMQLFIHLAPGTDYEALSAKVEDLIREHNGGGENAGSDLFLQPYGDMRLYGRFENGQLTGGRIDYVWAFVLVAGFVLLIACINFMNLATARSMQRAREIGVRKSVGATRRALLGQFLGESVLVAVVAFVAAMVLVSVALPGLNAITGKALGWGDVSLPMAALFFGLALAAGVVAGSYPALYLSSFEVVGVLRGGASGPGGHAGLRKGLVVFQFALSILLVISTLTLYRQVDYIRTKNLGLDKEQLIYAALEGPLHERYDAVKAELLSRPGIQSVTASHDNPLSVGSSTDGVEWDGKAPDDNVLFHYIGARHDFLETMGMELAAGRAFSPAFSADSGNVIINERAARAMGMRDPVGQRLAMWQGLPEWEQEGEIVGVVKDFHMASLHTEIEPTIIRLDPKRAGMLFVRIAPERTEAALASLEAVHKQFSPAAPFEYRFLDATYEEAYRTELMVGQLAAAFAVLAVVIACLGLFGLAAFTAEQRTKEVGIRKVLGASALGLVALLSKDFVKLVAVAFAVAAPVAYLLMDALLGAFAYRTSVGAAVFVVAGAGALFLALLTVGTQAFRAATANPTNALRAE